MKQLATIGLSLFLLTACGEEETDTKQESARYVKVFQVSDTGGKSHRIFPGKTKASQTADMSFQVAGELIDFPLNEGEEVEEGQVLARLDPTNFELDIRKLTAIRDNAKVELGRSATLLKKDFTSQSSHDLKLTQLEIAESDLGTAEERLDDATLTAPFAGKIGKTYVENYQQVAAKAPVLTLQQVDPIDVTVQLPEDVVAQIQQGNVVDHFVTFSVIPNQRFTAKYKESASIADSVTQTYDVVMTLPNPEGFNVLPGMTANVGVSYKAGDAQEGFLIPFSAVGVEPDGTPYIYVLTPTTHTLEKRSVSLTQPQDDQVGVTEGLQAGDTIIVAGINFLREGEKVQPLPEEFQP